jgi:hypothetical protein
VVAAPRSAAAAPAPPRAFPVLAAAVPAMSFGLAQEFFV